jgi:hypothetical protein
MNEQKSFLMHFAEMVEQYRSERRANSMEEASQPQRHSCLRRILRWLTPNGGTLLLITALILTQNVWARQMAAPAAPGPSATTVNYQGRLADSGGAPLDGAYGMSFSLWDAAAGGNLVWGPESHTAVPVSEGLFSVGLGSQTSGGIPTSAWNGDRYLEITVGGEMLSPRELIRSVPIAGMALTVPDGAIGTAQIADGAVTQAKAPSLLESGNGDDYEVYVGYAEVSSTDEWNEAYISFGRTFAEVLLFMPINHNVGTHYGYVVGVRSIKNSGARVRFSAPAGEYTYLVKYIVIGR